MDAPSPEQVRRYASYAHWKDVPHLAAAAQHGCRYLVTYNVTDYDADDVHGREASPQDESQKGESQDDDLQQRAGRLATLRVIRPGPLVRTVRAQLAGL